MNLEDKFYRYFMSDKFRSVGLSEAAQDLAKIAQEGQEVIFEDTFSMGEYIYCDKKKYSDLDNKLLKHNNKKVRITLGVKE